MFGVRQALGLMSTQSVEACRTELTSARKHLLAVMRDEGKPGCDGAEHKKKLKAAFDDYFQKFWQTMVADAAREDARDREEQAAAEQHEAEMYRLIDDDVRTRLDALRERAQDLQTEKRQQADYEKILSAWEGHVEAQFRARLETLKGESSARAKQNDQWAGVEVSAGKHASALSAHLDSLVEQALDGAGPSTSIGAAAIAGQTSLIDALLKALDQGADAKLQQKPASMPERDFNAMLDTLFR